MVFTYYRTLACAVGGGSCATRMCRILFSIFIFVDQLWTQGDTIIVNSTIWGTCGDVSPKYGEHVVLLVCM